MLLPTVLQVAYTGNMPAPACIGIVVGASVAASVNLCKASGWLLKDSGGFWHKFQLVCGVLWLSFMPQVSEFITGRACASFV